MVEESSPLLPPAEESIEAETDTALEPGPESGEPTPEPASEPSFVCDCGEWVRSACTGERFYREHEGKRYCIFHYPGKEKIADFREALQNRLHNNNLNFCGVWFPEEADFRGLRFTENAFFNDATFNGKIDLSEVTFLGDVSFSNARFCEISFFHSITFNASVYFRDTTFNEDASFIGGSFAAADFSGCSFAAKADFRFVTFNQGGNFRSADFMDAIFTTAIFHGTADFRSSNFSRDADFSGATFNGTVNFAFATFNHTGDFGSAVFKDYLYFVESVNERHSRGGGLIKSRALGCDPTLDFQHVRIEHSNRIAFHTLNLRPHWFVNVDPRRFIFTDVSWELDRFSIKEEIVALEAIGVSSPNRLLAIACRQLAENAETNNRYEEASNFRYCAMDLARRTKWKGWWFLKTDWLHMLYWAVSGYGERILRALGVLAGVWMSFVLLYTCVGFGQQSAKTSNEGASSATVASMPPEPMTIEDRIGQPLEFSRALTYSLAVMSLQKPEPKPLTGTAQTLVLLETIFGPVQAALLALAIRRKFMR